MKALYLGVVELQQFFLQNMSYKMHSHLSSMKNSKIKLILVNFVFHKTIFFFHIRKVRVLIFLF